MKRILNIQTGFTLLELLAAMVVLIAVGTIIGAILFASLRGATKTNTITNVRQNGNYAISQMTKMIRGAKTLDLPDPCVSPPSPTPIPTYPSVTFTSFDGGQTIFSCDSDTISSNSASLLDTSVVSLLSCSFTCSRTSFSDVPTIGINFTLIQSGISAFNEKKASIPFQTTVLLRNLSK